MRYDIITCTRNVCLASCLHSNLLPCSGRNSPHLQGGFPSPRNFNDSLVARLHWKGERAKGEKEREREKREGQREKGKREKGEREGLTRRRGLVGAEIPSKPGPNRNLHGNPQRGPIVSGRPNPYDIRTKNRLQQNKHLSRSNDLSAVRGSPCKFCTDTTAQREAGSSPHGRPTWACGELHADG